MNNLNTEEYIKVGGNNTYRIVERTCLDGYVLYVIQYLRYNWFSKIWKDHAVYTELEPAKNCLEVYSKKYDQKYCDKIVYTDE
jgi:hypothetical protein